jgi:ATP-dependent HslUV protease ATP-binding subunit HslU
MREEIIPKNILSIGPTGVGKTEIARRLATLVKAPFIKVEATKFTEVGYVGRDVESIIRDLMEVAVTMIRTEMRSKVKKKAEKKAKARILEVLVGKESLKETKDKFSKMLDEGKLDDKDIEIAVAETSSGTSSSSFDFPGATVGMINITEMIGKAVGGGKPKKQKMTVKKALKNIIEEESANLTDEEQIVENAIQNVENDGIVFIDEFDKICVKGSNAKGGDVSREGVQRDLLPLVEGTSVNTKYGMIKTDHILFIASGAFHSSKPSDLLPELQGRFPIRVQLKALTEADLVRILKEPESSLIKQYTALIGVENIDLDFKDSGINEIARIAHKLNGEVENIGARRLYALLEKILEEVSFKASDIKKDTKIIVDKKYVSSHLGDLANGKADLSKFIL